VGIFRQLFAATLLYYIATRRLWRIYEMDNRKREQRKQEKQQRLKQLRSKNRYIAFFQPFYERTEILDRTEQHTDYKETVDVIGSAGTLDDALGMAKQVARENQTSKYGAIDTHTGRFVFVGLGTEDGITNGTHEMLSVEVEGYEKQNLTPRGSVIMCKPDLD